MEADHETVRLVRNGPVVTVLLNRPKRRNGLTGPMMAALHEALTCISIDPSIHVVVFRGEGADFCPGADVKHVASGEAASAEGRGWSNLAEFNVSVLLHEMRAVTIAAIRGACAGAGLTMASACDLRVSSDTARFNTAFLDVGIAGDMGGPWTLPRILGAAKARELYFLPGKFDAAEALRIGLVSRVSSDEAFEADLAALTDRLARSAPLALTAMKANFLAAEKMGFADYIALESEKHSRLFRSEDTGEAFRAFVEKRAPVFRGR